MIYLANLTQLESQQQADLFVSNIRDYLLIHDPDAIDDNGNLKSRRHDGTCTDSAVTIDWDTPRELIDGRWAIPFPYPERFINRDGTAIPFDVVIAGYQGELIENPEFKEDEVA